VSRPAQRKPQAREAKNPLEWAVFGVGLALLLATVGALVWDAARGADGPPEPVVSLRAPQRTAAGTHRVPVVVVNRGGETAVGAQIEVVLHGADGGERERAELTLDYLPRGSRREAEVFFRADPAGGRLAARVVGYQLP
jgi:uncharacterized protein (TIGR02588 family)